MIDEQASPIYPVDPDEPDIDRTSVEIGFYAEGMGHAPRRWLAALAAVDWRGGGPAHDPSAGVAPPRLLKTGRRASVWHAPLTLDRAGPLRPDVDAIIKVARLAGPVAAMRYRLGLTPLAAQIRGARRLTRAGVPHATVLASLLVSPPRAFPREVLVLRRLSGPTLLEFIADRRPPAQRAEVARRLAAVLRALADARLINRDGKPSNVILTCDRPGDPQTNPGTPALIDTVAIRPAPPARRLALGPTPRELANLYLEPLGCGVAPSRTDIARLLSCLSPGACPRARRSRRRRLELAARVVERHGDPTPETNPLLERAPLDTPGQ